MRKHIFLSVLLSMILAVALAACAMPVAAPSGEPAPGAAPAETTLLVWDIWTRQVDSDAIDQLDREFEAANPGVKIDRVVKSFDDMKATAQLALSSPDGPDVAQINQGESDMVALVRAGLLTDLTSYSE